MFSPGSAALLRVTCYSEGQNRVAGVGRCQVVVSWKDETHSVSKYSPVRQLAIEPPLCGVSAFSPGRGSRTNPRELCGVRFPIVWL